VGDGDSPSDVTEDEIADLIAPPLNGRSHSVPWVAPISSYGRRITNEGDSRRYS
jgi:hypothetical protein